MNSDKKIGVLGEDIAVRYLKNKGYKILERNFSVRLKNGPQLGEIDLIAEKDGKIVFVEVKAQTGNTAIQPEQKVNFQKQEKIIKTAEIWLDRNKKSQDTEWQIDVMSIILDFKNKKAKITHFKNV